MPRIPLSLIAAALVAVAPAEFVRLKVTRNGKVLGMATYGIAAFPGQGKTTELRVEAKGPRSTVSMTEATRYDRAGREVKKEMMQSVDKRTLSHLTAVYNAQGVTVTGESADGKESKKYPLPKGAVTIDPSRNWFLSVRPKPGAKATSTTFSLSRFKWRTTQTTYVGTKAVMIGNRKVNGHLVRAVSGNDKAEMVVDNRGFPWTITDNRGLRMVRVEGARK